MRVCSGDWGRRMRESGSESESESGSGSGSGMCLLELLG